MQLSIETQTCRVSVTLSSCRKTKAAYLLAGSDKKRSRALYKAIQDIKTFLCIWKSESPVNGSNEGEKYHNGH